MTLKTAIRALIVALVFSRAVDAQPPTGEPRPLAEILSECECMIPTMPQALLTTLVLTYERLVDEQGFVVAFWTASTNRSAFEVIAGNVANGTWQHAEFATDDTPDDPRHWAGPIWSVKRTGDFILVGLRVAIDGIATSILTSDLARLGVTYGMVRGVLPGRLVLYEHAQPHFAPTHYVELAVLDTRSGREREIYPPKPYDAVRRAAIGRERARYAKLGERWCRENNHHCDPERFDNSWSDEPIAVNAAMRAFAFGIEYGDGVIAACSGLDDLDAIACHETPLTAWQRAFPNEDRGWLLRRAAAEPRRITWR